MTVAEKWADFCKRVVPNGASAVQVREMKRAFYGGALVMLNLVTDTADNEEDEAVLQIESFHKEVHAFFENDLSQSTG